MRKIILLVMLLTSTISFAQKTVKMKENAGYGKAKFHILKSDGITKHGEYKITSYTPPFRNIVKGNYKNGQRDGVWIEKHDQSGSQIRIQGNYDTGKKIGEWKYFDSEGKLIQVFDYEKNELTTNSECGTDKEFEVEINETLETKKLNCPPTRIGGIKIFTKDLYREITKKSPFEINSSGRTEININETLHFFVTKEGIVENIQFSGKEKNQELAKVVENYLEENKEGWISGEIDGEKIKAKIIIPISIRMMF